MTTNAIESQSGNPVNFETGTSFQSNSNYPLQKVEDLNILCWQSLFSGNIADRVFFFEKLIEHPMMKDLGITEIGNLSGHTIQNPNECFSSMQQLAIQLVEGVNGTAAPAPEINPTTFSLYKTDVSDGAGIKFDITINSNYQELDFKLTIVEFDDYINRQGIVNIKNKDFDYPDNIVLYSSESNIDMVSSEYIMETLYEQMIDMLSGAKYDIQEEKQDLIETGADYTIIDTTLNKLTTTIEEADNKTFSNYIYSMHNQIQLNSIENTDDLNEFSHMETKHKQQIFENWIGYNLSNYIDLDSILEYSDSNERINKLKNDDVQSLQYLNHIMGDYLENSNNYISSLKRGVDLFNVQLAIMAEQNGLPAGCIDTQYINDGDIQIRYFTNAPFFNQDSSTIVEPQVITTLSKNDEKFKVQLDYIFERGHPQNRLGIDIGNYLEEAIMDTIALQELVKQPVFHSLNCDDLTSFKDLLPNYPPYLSEMVNLIREDIMRDISVNAIVNYLDTIPESQSQIIVNDILKGINAQTDTPNWNIDKYDVINLALQSESVLFANEMVYFNFDIDNTSTNSSELNLNSAKQSMSLSSTPSLNINDYLNNNQFNSEVLSQIVDKLHQISLEKQNSTNSFKFK